MDSDEETYLKIYKVSFLVRVGMELPISPLNTLKL
mgnify:CR=1 FL=1